MRTFLRAAWRPPAQRFVPIARRQILEPWHLIAALAFVTVGTRTIACL